jgi:hypothetical protein
LRLSVDRPFKVHSDHDLKDVGPFKSGIALLGRGQRTEIFIENAIGNYDRLKNEILKIEATWTDAVGEHYRRVFDIRFDEYDKVVRIGTPPLYTIATAIKKLQKDVAQIGSGFSALKVITETAGEAEKRRGIEVTWARYRSLPPDQQEEVADLIKKRAESFRDQAR